MKTSDELYEKVNAFIDKLPYNREPKSLYEPIQYVLSLGGKRIRPVLMLLSYNLWKDDPERILMPAVAVETYHNYTLLHDDLMDNADKRRGHVTVHKKRISIGVANIFKQQPGIQLRLGDGKMPPRDPAARHERDAGSFRHGGETLLVKVRLGVHMDEEIGVFAVEKAQLLFEDRKISVREDEPGMAHRNPSLVLYANYTERRRESQSVRAGRGELSH